jgi:precorrin-4/cobalt-precorrin-4 C11-methyltransferase
MKVYFIGAGPGDPELLTVKASRLINEAQCIIYAGSLVPDAITSLFPPGVEKHDSAGMTLEQTSAVIKCAADRDTDILRIHSGDPSIYGAINEQMSILDSLGIEYEVIPGISSFQAAAAALKTELTAPEISQTIVLTRTSGRTPLPPNQELEKLAATKATLCIFLSILKTDEIVDTLMPYYGKDCPAAVVFHASRSDQLVIRCPLSDLPEKTRQAGIKKTALIIVGHALGRGVTVSNLYDKAFSHGCRNGEE